MQPCNAATGTGNPRRGISDANSACVPEARAGLVKASLRISLSYLTTFPSCPGFPSGFPVLPSGPASLSRVRSRLLCLASCPAFPASVFVLLRAAAPLPVPVPGSAAPPAVSVALLLASDPGRASVSGRLLGRLPCPLSGLGGMARPRHPLSGLPGPWLCPCCWVPSGSLSAPTFSL